jgi:uncharacterized protein (TIGR04255 family)
MTHLPSYERPPVIEVALSATIKPIEGWALPHFGLLWQKWRDDLPTTEVYPPLPAHPDELSSVPPPPPPEVVQFQIEHDPTHARCWFVSADKSELVQVQRDRFVFNWRRTEAGTPYPRYMDRVRPQFGSRYASFSDFLKEQGLAPLQVLQVEVAYVNEVERQDHLDAGDFSRVFNLAGPAAGADAYLPTPYGVRLSASYMPSPGPGVLHIHTYRAARGHRQVYQFRLIARVPPQGSSIDEVLGALDRGREWIVRGFTDLTTAEMHRMWGRTS